VREPQDLRDLRCPYQFLSADIGRHGAIVMLDSDRTRRI
jgi:hypothetical protein